MSAFSYCKELKVVELPNSVRVIDGYAFTDCTNLKTINLNNDIITIGGNAFSGCKSLELTSLPSNLTTLGQGAFMSCGNGLQLTFIPAGIEILESWTFSSCPNVKISIFGSNNGENRLTTIGNNCFYNAGNGTSGPNVIDITFNSSVNSIGVQAFAGYATNTLQSVYFAKDFLTNPTIYGYPLNNKDPNG